MALFDIFKRKPKVEKRDNNPEVEVRYVGQPAKKYAAITEVSRAMQNSIVYRGVSILSDSVASVPLLIYRRDKNGY